MFSVKATKRPKWYNFRWQLANVLVKLARKIHPKNPEVEAFMLQVAMDQILYGQSITRIAPKEFYKSLPDGK